jgi:hypothetical protein
MIVSSSATSGLRGGSGAGGSPDRHVKGSKKVKYHMSAYQGREEKAETEQRTLLYTQPLLLQKLGDCHSLFRVPVQTFLHTCDHVCGDAPLKMVELLRWATRTPRTHSGDCKIRKLNLMRGIWDRLHFLVDREVLEWRVAVDHLIENAA